MRNIRKDQKEIGDRREKQQGEEKQQRLFKRRKKKSSKKNQELENGQKKTMMGQTTQLTYIMNCKEFLGTRKLKREQYYDLAKQLS